MLEIKGSYLVKNQIQQEDLPVNDPQVINQLLTYGSITDIDENVYKTIQIGNQTWMAENLRTTRFNNGTVIPKVRWYDNNIGAYKNTYGALYDHYCVNTGDLCPTGWHVPTDEEWKELEMALGMTRAAADTSYLDFDVYGMGFRGTDQGTQLKAATGWSAWEGKLVLGTNASGFSALPAGDTGWDGVYECIGLSTSFWCSGAPWARTLSTEQSKISRALYFEFIGFSVRCIKN
jgi:uncharacterized protein (TIGR02145 family)